MASETSTLPQPPSKQTARSWYHRCFQQNWVLPHCKAESALEVQNGDITIRLPGTVGVTRRRASIRAPWRTKGPPSISGRPLDYFIEVAA